MTKISSLSILFVVVMVMSSNVSGQLSSAAMQTVTFGVHRPHRYAVNGVTMANSVAQPTDDAERIADEGKISSEVTRATRSGRLFPGISGGSQFVSASLSLPYRNPGLKAPSTSASTLRSSNGGDHLNNSEVVLTLDPLQAGQGEIVVTITE